MSIGDQALYLAQLKGLDNATAKSELNSWFEKFEITDWWDKKGHRTFKGNGPKNSIYCYCFA